MILFLPYITYMFIHNHSNVFKNLQVYVTYGNNAKFIYDNFGNMTKSLLFFVLLLI